LGTENVSQHFLTESAINYLLFKECKYLQWDLFNTSITEYSLDM